MVNTTNVSAHVTWKEATFSETACRLGLSNVPDRQESDAIKRTALNIFEPVREWADQPLGINSFFRSPEVNAAVTGNPFSNSHHKYGMALDIDADKYAFLREHPITNAEIFLWIAKNLKFTQMIWEYGDDMNPAWVHVAYDPNNLKRKLTIKRSGEDYKSFDLSIDDLTHHYRTRYGRV